jgi:hypothetical protein
MTRQQPEKKVRNDFVKAYKFHTLKGDILWWKILQAENEQWTPAGTLDSVVGVNQGDGNICLWFNEFKAKGKRMVVRDGEKIENYRYEQMEFVKKMEGKPKIYCSITDDVSQFQMHLNNAKRI